MHRVHQGDCLDILADMPDASVDVIVTSPPYNLGIAYSLYGDSRGEADYLDWMVRVCTSLRRVLRPDGSFFLNVAGSSTQPWLPFELLVRLRSLFALQADTSVGHFKPVPGERFLHRNHEHIFHLTQTGDVRLDRLANGVPFKDKSNIARRGHTQDLRCRGDTWFIPYETVRSKAQKFSHPGTFPLDLPRWCIRLHGKQAATVLDPFCGAGTTLVAATEEGCTGIGIEIDPDYVATAEARLSAMLAA
jgi:site-specific DNA-methyltransferase (adenine-specific)